MTEIEEKYEEKRKYAKATDIKHDVHLLSTNSRCNKTRKKQKQQTSEIYCQSDPIFIHT